MFKDKYRSDNERITPDEGLLKYLAKQMEDAKVVEQEPNLTRGSAGRGWIRHHARPILALAACFAVVVTGLAMYTAWLAPAKTSSSGASSSGTGSVRSHVSYVEMYALIKSMEQKEATKNPSDIRFGAAVADTAVKSTASNASYSQTNVQVEGVDEADIVKTDGKFIYSLSGNTIMITDVRGGVMKTASKISVSTTDKTKESRYPREIYVQGDRLVVLESVYEATTVNSGGTFAERNAVIDYAFGYGDGSHETAAAIYDIADHANPKLLKTIGQSGSYLTSRIADGKMYMITNYYLSQTAEKSKPDTYVPMLYNDGTSSAMAAENISVGANPQGRQYIVVTAINVNQPDGILSSKSVYGCGSTVYADAGNMLIASSTTVETSRTAVSTANTSTAGNGQSISSDAPAAVAGQSDAVAPDAGTVETTASNDKPVGNVGTDEKGSVSVTYSSQTDLIRFSLNGGKISLEATGSVPGSLLSQYSMDEQNGVFRLVTTNYSYTEVQSGTGNTATVSYGSTGNTVSGLYTLGQDLKIVGSIQDVAPGEKVYSVRFVGPVGYFVTFRQVDPLFAVDLSNPANPKILSELKIPGLSDYLHPYADGLLFGLGRDADTKTGHVNGLKLSMFDVSDPSRVTEKQTLLLSQNWSEASYNPKAIIVSSERGLIAFPAEDKYLVYTYSSDKGFTQKASLAVNTESGGVMRGAYIDNVFYVCSGSSITAYSMEDYSIIGKLAF